MQRLKSRAQFQAVLAGSTVARTPHFALHQLGLPLVLPAEAAELFPQQQVTWLGAMVPKRWARRAVTRNTIKRQVYAVAEGFEPTLPLAAYVLRLRAAFDKKQFVSATSDLLKQAVRSELHLLLARASTGGPRAAGGAAAPARQAPATATAPAMAATPPPPTARGGIATPEQTLAATPAGQPQATPAAGEAAAP